MKQEAPPRFPVDCAFVVHFALSPGGNLRAGRVEHVVSGRAGRFNDEAQLIAFVAEVFEALEGDEARAGTAPLFPEEENNTDAE